MDRKKYNQLRVVITLFISTIVGVAAVRGSYLLAAIGAFLLLVPSQSGLSVFSRGEFAYLDSLGMVFAYLTLFLIAVYSISYHFLNKKYGGGDE